MNELLLRTISGVVFVLVVLGMIFLGANTLLALALIIFSLSIFEFRGIFRIRNDSLFVISLLSGMILIISAFLFSADRLNITHLILAFSIILLMFVSDYIFNKASAAEETGKMILGTMWIGISLMFFVSLGRAAGPAIYDPSHLLILFVLVWINDIAAYLAGSIFGKLKLAPRISPGKTIEGFISGILFTAFGGYIIFLIRGDHTILFWVVLGAVISLGATAGDLFESKLKRETGSKDSGNLIPGHGGVLDRFDSTLFAAPLYYIVLLIF